MDDVANMEIHTTHISTMKEPGDSVTFVNGDTKHGLAAPHTAYDKQHSVQEPSAHIRWVDETDDERRKRSNTTPNFGSQSDSDIAPLRRRSVNPSGKPTSPRRKSVRSLHEINIRTQVSHESAFSRGSAGRQSIVSNISAKSDQWIVDGIDTGWCSTICGMDLWCGLIPTFCQSRQHKISKVRQRSMHRGCRTGFDFGGPVENTHIYTSRRTSIGHTRHPSGLLTYVNHAVVPVLSDGQPGRMFSMQQSLPKLPVPALDQTLAKYLHAVEPILTDEDYCRAEELTTDFRRPGCIGTKLQALLEERAKTHINWLEEWWLNAAYLEYRLPCAIHVNPGIAYPEQNFQTEEQWLRFAARMISGTLDYKDKIDKHTLPVEYAGKNALCMKQFYSILSGCRIPGKFRDEIITYSPDKPDPPRHICVAHNNVFFKVDVYCEDGLPLGTEQIFHQLEECVRVAFKPKIPVGVLTTDHRNTWGSIFPKLIKDPQNRESVDAIQKSIFLMCLDQPVGIIEEHGDRKSTIAAHVDHGCGVMLNSGNRWFDKTIQIICGRDGSCGLNYEHAPAEGPPIISLIDHTLDYIVSNQSADPANVNTMKEPQKLFFNFTDKLVEAIDFAAEALDATIHDLDMTAFSFSQFGKNLIKSCKVSPDAFIQVAMQLAYFRMYGESCATYESGSLRRFQHGRTETIRSCSVESHAYCVAMQDPKVKMEKKEKLLRDAITAHRNYTADVMAGEGVDRHLLGLKFAALESGLEIPDLFIDPIYAQSVHWKLSTSQVPSKHNVCLAFAPVVPDGYGVCYNPMPDNINFCCSAWNQSPETVSTDMAESIKGALLDSRDVIQHSTSGSSDAALSKL